MKRVSAADGWRTEHAGLKQILDCRDDPVAAVEAEHGIVIQPDHVP